MDQLKPAVSADQRPIRLLQVDLSLDVSSALAAVRVLEQHCRRLGGDQQQCEDVLLVLEELLTNLIRHVLQVGSGQHAHLEVSVQNAAEGPRLFVQLWDDGPAYDPLTTTPEPGFGLRIIRALVSQPRVRACAGNNRLDFELPLVMCSGHRRSDPSCHGA